MDFTADEVIVEPPVRYPLQRIYSDQVEPPVEVLVYPLEEILAEKMRTLLQPTEEVFTMPHKDKVDGVLSSSKPLRNEF